MIFRSKVAELGLVLTSVALATSIGAGPNFIAKGRAHPVPIGRFVEIPYGVSAEHAWPTEGGDAQRRGRSRFDAPASAPSRRWEARLGVGRALPPAIASDGTLYVATGSGLAALSPKGEGRWRLTAAMLSSTPSITPGGGLALGTQNGELLRISESGELRLRRRMGSGVRGSPLVLPDGSVVVCAFDRSIQRFDAEGRRLFRIELPAPSVGIPAADEQGRLFVPVGSELFVLSHAGRVMARVPLGDGIGAGPAIANDGTVWVLTLDGRLHALAPDLSIRGTTELGGPVSRASALAVAGDGSVRVALGDGGLRCVGPGGIERFSVRDEGAFSASLTVDRRGTTLLVDHRGRLLAIDAAGRVRWRVETGTRTDAAPVLGSDGTVYVSTIGSTLQAWR